MEVGEKWIQWILRGRKVYRIMGIHGGFFVKEKNLWGHAWPCKKRWRWWLWQHALHCIIFISPNNKHAFSRAWVTFGHYRHKLKGPASDLCHRKLQWRLHQNREMQFDEKKNEHQTCLGWYKRVSSCSANHGKYHRWPHGLRAMQHQCAQSQSPLPKLFLKNLSTRT